MSRRDRLIILITRMVAFLVVLIALGAFKEEPDALKLDNVALEIDEYSLFADCNHFDEILEAQ